MKQKLLISVIAIAAATTAAAQWSNNPSVNMQLSAEGVYDWDSRILSDGSFAVYFNRPSKTVIYEDTVFALKHLLMRYNSDGTPAWSEPVTVANTPNRDYTMQNKYLFTDEYDNIYVNIPDVRHDTFGQVYESGWYNWYKMSLTVYKINKEGMQMWGDTGVSIDKDGHVLIALSNGISLENGSVILSWFQEDFADSKTANTTKIARISSGGELQWVKDLSPSGHISTLVNGGSSQFIIVYMSGASLTSNTIICAQKLNASGNTVWGQTELYNRGGFPSYGVPSLTVLPVELGAIVSWSADPDGNTYEDAYCSYVTRNGELAFASGVSGVKLGYHPNTRQFSPAGAYDKENKYAYYIWREATSGEIWNSMVGQKVSLSGELIWDEDGVIIAPMLQRRVDYPSAQIDSTGNPCFFYFDNSPITGYVQKHSPTDGGEMWRTTFTTLSSSGALKTLPYANGQWIALWTRGNSLENISLYAQNILNDGTLGDGSNVNVSEESPELSALIKSTSNKNFVIATNPAANSTSFIISNMQGKRVEIAIYNISGQKVATIFNGRVTTDEQKVTWNIPAQLRKGMYFATLHGGNNNNQNIKLIIDN